MASNGEEQQRSVAVVTGAGRGIGKVVALRLHAAGYLVVATDRTESMADETATELGSDSSLTSGLRHLDVTDRSAVRAIVERIADRFGRLDVLVNNAMWMRYAPLASVTEKDVDRMLAVGLKGPLWMTQAVAPVMARQGRGAIVNIASLAASLATPDASVYSAVKGAVLSLTRQTALDLGRSGIRVNAVAPGTIETPGLQGVMSDEARHYRLSRAPLGRLGTPADIAETVVFLASSASAFTTGQVVTVDGGISAAM